MKKTFTILTAALMLLAIFIPSMIAVGQTVVTFTPATVQGTGTSASGNNSMSSGVITISSNGGGFGIANNGDYRIGSGKNLDVVTSDGTITQIVFTFSQNSLSLRNGQPGSYNTTTKTWTGSATSVGFTTSGGQCRISRIDVTYTPSSGSSTVATPEISGTTPFYPSTEVTITCATSGATIQYSTNNGSSWSNYSAPFTITATTTVLAKATKTGMTDSDTASKVFTYEAPLANIAALTSQTVTASYNVTLSNAVVTYVNGNYAYIQDGSGAVVYYKNGHGLTAGDALNGTATVAYQLRNANPQITDLSGVTPTSGTAPDPTTIAASAWNYTFANVLSQYFQITGATINTSNNKFYITLNNESVQLYKVGTALSGLDLSRTYTIIGFPTLYNTTKELQIFVDPVVEATSDPTISVTPLTLSSFTYVVNNGPSAAQTISVSGENLTANITLSLTDGQDSAFEISLSESSGYSNSLSLTQTSSTVSATTVYVRMRANLAVLAAGYDDDLTIASTGASSKTIALSGSVTEPEPENVTWDLTTNSYSSSSTTEVDWTSSYATMVLTKGSSSTNANNYLGGGNNTVTRFYKSQVLTFNPVTNYTITSIVVTATTNSYASALVNSTWTNATASATDATVTITPNNGNISCSAVLSAAVWSTQVKVYYTESTATNYSITINSMSNGTIVSDHSEATEGTPITLTVNPNVGYALTANSLQVSGIVTLTKVDDATYTFNMPAADVTVSASFSAYSGTYYTLVTNTSELIAGRHYIIASSNAGGAAKAMGAQQTNYRDEVDATVFGTMIYETAGVAELILDKDESNYWVLYDENTPGYLYASSPTGSNNMGTRTSNLDSNQDRGQWTISFAEGGATNIVSQIIPNEGKTAANTIKYNAGNARFSCYTPTSTMASVYLYMKAGETTCTYLNDIKGYLDAANNDGYVLVASSITDDITPSISGGFFTAYDSEDFDLYRFNPTATGAEWENWKQTGDDHYHFSVVKGRGYLYASKTSTTLKYIGTLNTASTVTLAYTGWNLIGNSSNVTKYVSGEFYVMNSEGSEITAATSSAVNRMQGIFVNGTVGNTITFSPTAKRLNNSRVILNIVDNNSNVIDRAIVNLNEGGTLPKFMINENNTKVYIPQEDDNYAVVLSNGQGTMPVNFKAKEMGMYTISVETEGIDLSYLHLIDRLTGEDVNLLMDSKYSFIASNSDMESRFILSFDENGINANNNETFAFQNGSEIIVNGEGELQIFDVMGRNIMNTMINGVQTVNVKSNGVYIFKLNEKTQKIIVR